MAWYWQYGGQPTRNALAMSGSVTAGMYWFLKLLTTHAGNTWTCVSSGDGVSNYNPFGDLIANFGTGPNALGNDGAWFVLRDPGDKREIMVQRGLGELHWIFHYSAQARFLGGPSGPGTPPTAADAIVVSNFASTITDNSPNGTIFNIGCQDSPEGDVYPFWLMATDETLGSHSCIFYHDAIVDSLSPAGDADKSVIAVFRSGYSPNFSSGASLGHQSNSLLKGWQRYGEVGAEAGVFTIPDYASAGVILPGSLGVNPNDGNTMLFPAYAARFTGDAKGTKGQLKNLVYKPANDSYSDLYYDGTEYYVVSGDVAFRGWPDSTLPFV